LNAENVFSRMTKSKPSSFKHLLLSDKLSANLNLKRSFAMMSVPVEDYKRTGPIRKDYFFQYLYEKQICYAIKLKNTKSPNSLKGIETSI